MRPEFMKVLSERDISLVHESSVRILVETGVMIQLPELLAKLGNAGAVIDRNSGIAKFPEKVVERFLGKAPERMFLFSRKDREPIEIGNGITRSISGFDATFSRDYGTGKKHPVTKEEVGNYAWIADRLENIDMVGNQGIPQDVPQEKAGAHSVEALLQNTAKHLIIAPDTGSAANTIYGMIGIATGKDDIGQEPVVSCHISPSAPLRWTPNACDIILETVKNGIPFLILPSPMAGITSPVTIAGHLVEHNTEILSGYIISQVLREGHPVVYCNAPTLFNMREGNPIIATPETMLLRIAGAQMARFYDIPCHSIGFDTDAHKTDQQCSWEKALTAMACVCAGIDFIVNLGMFSTGMTVSYEQLVLDDEVFGFLRRFQNGIEVSEDHLAVDVIQKIGSWGAYLEEDHTLKHFKKENWFPDVSCRKLFEPWENEGSLDAEATANKKALAILKRERRGYLDRKTKKEIERLIAAV